MFEFYEHLSFIGKTIFLISLIVIFCSMFSKCYYCEYLPLKLKWDTSGYVSNPYPYINPIFINKTIQNPSEPVIPVHVQATVPIDVKANIPIQQKIKQNSLVKGGNSDMNPKNQRVLLFYVDWCGHCKNFKPKWTQLKQMFDGVHMTEINGDHQPSVTQKYKVDKYPTIVYQNGNKAYQYNGEYTIDGLKDFIIRNSNR